MEAHNITAQADLFAFKSKFHVQFFLRMLKQDSDMFPVMSANRYVQECHKDTKEYYIPQKYKEIST
jgi:hypothetical protein